MFTLLYQLSGHTSPCSPSSHIHHQSAGHHRATPLSFNQELMALNTLRVRFGYKTLCIIRVMCVGSMHTRRGLSSSESSLRSMQHSGDDRAWRGASRGGPDPSLPERDYPTLLSLPTPGHGSHCLRVPRAVRWGSSVSGSSMRSMHTRDDRA